MTTVSESFSKGSIEAMYTLGYNFYEHGQYEKAMHFFRFLTMADMNNRKYWMGLGASYQMLRQHERALQCYGYAAQLDEKDPYAHWHAFECFSSIGNKEQAYQALGSAETTAKLDPESFKVLLARVSLIKENNKIKKKAKK